jgi:hypothetical protein
MATVKTMLPNCGLFRTTKALPGSEEAVPAGVLVYFHNHSDPAGGGLPQVIVPDHNIHNRWHFHGPGVAFRTSSWAESIVKVLEQGFYVLRGDLVFDGGSWPRGALVQLGYTRNAEPILFIAQARANLEENDLFFSDKGVKVTNDKLSLLDRVTVFEEPGGAHTAGDSG